MPLIDILIVTAVVVSMVIGVVRGFVKEAISIAALLIAIWTALYFGPAVGEVAKSWLDSTDMRIWFGRILVFAIVLSIGGLLGWGISKLVRLSALNGMDRFVGTLFGAARGVLLVAVFVLAGEYAGFSNDPWWARSQTIPYFALVGEWIEQMAPQGYELLTPDSTADSLPIEL